LLNRFCFSVRFRSLEDEGFLRKRASAVVPQQSHGKIKLEPDLQNDSDSEDLFEFPSDKKARLTACEDDGDIFAFPDDAKPQPLRKDQPLDSAKLPKKRKSENKDTTCELNSYSKRPLLEKDIPRQQTTNSYKNEPVEHSVSPAGFLTVHHTKVSLFHVDSFFSRYTGVLSLWGASCCIMYMYTFQIYNPRSQLRIYLRIHHTSYTYTSSAQA
jgi:hypothetical protein